jgi:hypothetical protein
MIPGKKANSIQERQMVESVGKKQSLNYRGKK